MPQAFPWPGMTMSEQLENRPLGGSANFDIGKNIKSNRVRTLKPLSLQSNEDCLEYRRVNRRLVVAWAQFICIGPPAGLLGQAPEGSEPRQSLSPEAPNQDQPRGYNKGLPAWLKLGVELRGRAESGTAFDSDSDDNFELNRLRLDVDVRPAPWIRFAAGLRIQLRVRRQGPR